MYPVLNILYTLGQKSQISEQLRAMSVGESPDDVADDFGQHQTYFKLGYFSLIGLLRLHCLLGDYNQALLTVKHLEFDPKVSLIMPNVVSEEFSFFSIFINLRNFVCRVFTTQCVTAWLRCIILWDSLE